MRPWVAFAALLLAVSGSAAGQVYKCEIQGKTAYQDSPCPGAGEEYIPERSISSMGTGGSGVSAAGDTTSRLHERAERQRRQAQRLREIQNEQDRIRDAYESGQVAKGMTQSQVEELWGPAWESLVSYDEAGNRCVTWYYGGPIRTERPEVTFCDGIVTRYRNYGK